jgi:hypothetical protein
VAPFVLHWGQNSEEEAMQFAYRLRRDGEEWIAETDAIEAEGHGPTPAEALLELRTVLTERFTEPNAMAPPLGPSRVSIDLEPMPQTLGTSILREAQPTR